MVSKFSHVPGNGLGARDRDKYNSDVSTMEADTAIYFTR